MDRFLGLLFSIFCLSVFGQTKTTDKTLLGQVSDGNFMTVTIRQFAERYERKEICLIYEKKGLFLIHALLKSNGNDKRIDTTFQLTEKHMKKINDFGENFENSTIPMTNFYFAGTRTIYNISVNGENKQLEDRKGFSLLLNLLEP
jgi:hypothetical protein